MNQILINTNLKKQHQGRKITFFKVLFSVSLSAAFIFSTIFIFYLSNIYSKEKNAKSLSKNFAISSLYSSNQNYSTQSYVTSKVSTITSTSPFIIGAIKIDKLKIDYPILSTASEEYLSIAPCRFAGPDPNNIGNLCIAGHNYIDNTFFAKITNLENDDEITIYDLNGNSKSYYVTSKFEVSSDNLECTLQNTNGEMWLTLMTCNSLRGTRHIVRATAK